ncbi:DUF2786 domain-containing protein [Lentzea sp. NBRC 102530]|uniref:DUF2786 domain-containing protein n=1 Tax=Lentzea sp. NBRC 102530 TaxID=3032201 RepID=UPI0024A40B7A|nr:DUF2786 domain-containing protein [Lentzea sp. NBRC 102530]GLY51314.1 hypothetical protein Lesp01_49700 [Lentzea sp. NBRC 102530]
MATKTSNARDDKAKMIAKVQALLNQAKDSGVTKEEAQAFAAKAAELMTRHALDAAIFKAENDKRPDVIKLLRFEISGQGYHGKGRAECAAAVAEAYGCSVAFEGNIMNSKTRWVLIVGTASALSALEVLLPSILDQAELRGRVEATAYRQEVKADYETEQELNRARRVYFRSYLAAFGAGVAYKITEFRTDLAEEVAETSGALVLASEAERVAAKFEKLYGSNLKTVAPDKVSLDGRADGFRAGRTADTGQSKLKSGKTATK